MEADKNYYESEHYKVSQAGTLTWIKPVKTEGGEVIGIDEPIANHAPMLIRIVRKEDGFITNEVVEFSARRNFKNEAPVAIDKKTMIGSQPHVLFSPGCRIFLEGKGHTARYTEFMQMQAETANVETVYSHTGWIETEDGEKVYLNGDYSIDKNGLSDAYQVELDPDFRCFKFYPVDDNTEDCFNTVMNKLDEAVPNWVSVPMLAYVFLSPLNEMLRREGKEPCFSFYLIGKTGSFKSSLSKLLLCFFGRLNYADTAPITFLDTQNAIGRKLAVGADIPLLLDDRRPTNNSADKQRYEGVEKYVSSAIGDRAARGRLNADSTAKVSYVAKSNLIVTAEEAFVNIGSSSIARSVSVELSPGTVDFTALQNLQDTPQHFNKVMQLYIQWVIQNYSRIQTESDTVLRRYREVFSEAGHARLATAFSQMMFGYHTFLWFVSEKGFISEDDVTSRMGIAKDIFLDMCSRQSKKVDNEKPTILFIELLKEMLDTKKVILKDLGSTKNTEEGEVNPPELSQSCIGYKDDTCIYLMPRTAYTAVYMFYAESGYTFPATDASLWKMFADEGKSLHDTGRNDKRKKIKGEQKRYICLLSSVLKSEGDEKDE